jgi:hypothetical protein
MATLAHPSNPLALAVLALLFVRFFTEQMRLLLAFDSDFVTSADPVARHRSASRITLRQVLLTELDNVHLAKLSGVTRNMADELAHISRTEPAPRATFW